MADLIDRDALIAYMCNLCGASCNLEDECCSSVDAVSNAPAIDAVEVVRCGECVYGNADGMICCGVGFLMPDHATFPDHFCNFGERKET